MSNPSTSSRANDFMCGVALALALVLLFNSLNVKNWWKKERDELEARR